MRCVPLFFIFLFQFANAFPNEEIAGSERETVLSVLTAAGAHVEGDRKLTCSANTGCDTDCNCASCSSTYTYMSTTSKCCKNLSNCIAYDPNTCLCTGCSSSLYKVNTKGKCVCVPVTGSVVDKKCAVIGCSSGYTYLSTVKKCCKNVDNCGTYDASTCACTGCVSTLYSLKSGKCVCKTIKGCSQYDTNCTCTVHTCTGTHRCTGTVNSGVYICDGTYCPTSECIFACGFMSFYDSQVQCYNDACDFAHFYNSNVICHQMSGCNYATFTDSVVTCDDGGSAGGCNTIETHGGTVYCDWAETCQSSYFGLNTKVRCTVDGACGDITLIGATVDCVTLHSCDDRVKFTGGGCCSSGYCPTGTACGLPTPVPTTPAPTYSTVEVRCPSGQYVTGLKIEFGAAINRIFGLLCSGSTTSYLSTDGMGAHVHDTDPTENPTNSGGYCQYSVGLLLYTPTNTVNSGLTLKGCNNVSQGPYGSPSKDVQPFTCPTKYVGISAKSESWTDTFGVYYPALLSQFTMICG